MARFPAALVALVIHATVQSPGKITAAAMTCAVGMATIESPTSCSACPAGWVPANGTMAVGDVVLEGARSCARCPRGTFQPRAGGLACKACAPPTSSVGEGAAACDGCAAGFFKNPVTKTCSPCDVNAVCEGGLQLPAPKRGFYIDRTDLTSFGNQRIVFACWFAPMCIGSIHEATGLVHSPDCWAPAGIKGATQLCDDDSLMCAPGATGFLCTNCKIGFTFDHGLQECLPCKDANFSVSSYSLASLVLWLVGLWVYKSKLPAFVQKSHTLAIIELLDTAKLKTFISFAQVVFATSHYVGSMFPFPASLLIQQLSLVEGNKFGPACSSDYHGEINKVIVYLQSTGFVLAAAAAVGAIRMKLAPPAREQRWRIFCQHSFLITMFLWASVPLLTLNVVELFDCIDTPRGSVLRVDTSSSCESAVYGTRRLFFVAIIFLLLAIPLACFAVLWRVRKRLSPRLREENESLAKTLRSRDRGLTHLGFLFKEYRPQLWWWECLMLYQRIAVSALPAALPPVSRAYVVMLISVATLLLAAEIRPCIRDSDNSLLMVTQLACIVIASTLLERDSGPRSEFEALIGWLLFVLGICIALSVLGYSIMEHRKRLHVSYTRIARARSSIENSSSFSSEKFKSSLEAIVRYSLPPAHALVFHYCSLKDAALALLSGIPSTSLTNGILFTSLQPHELSTASNERPILWTLFPAREAMLTIAIDARLLVPLDKTGDGQFFTLPARVLSAMRPMIFSEQLIDPGPWRDGQVLLAPQCIIRAYQLAPTSPLDTLSSSSQLGVPPGAIGVDKQLDMISPLLCVGNSTPSVSTAGIDMPRSTGKSPKAQIQTVAPIASLSFMKPGYNGDQIRSISTEVQMITTKQKRVSKRESTHRRVSNVKVTIIRDAQVCPPTHAHTPEEGVRVSTPETCSEYIRAMKIARLECASRGLVALYHYTSATSAGYILEGGFRMSTQGQGDGGVYFSTLGPASYGLGTAEYEENIIVDCFGVERLGEYKGKHLLDVCIVYGVEPMILQQAPGGREHARMITKACFRDLSLTTDRFYFLRPDRIVAAFLLDTASPPSRSMGSREELLEERACDVALAASLSEVEARCLINAVAARQSFEYVAHMPAAQTQVDTSGEALDASYEDDTRVSMVRFLGFAKATGGLSARYFGRSERDNTAASDSTRPHASHAAEGTDAITRSLSMAVAEATVSLQAIGPPMVGPGRKGQETTTM